MAKYILGIDETGSFSMGSDSSFVCGIVVTKEPMEVKKAYQMTYYDFGFKGPLLYDEKSLLSYNNKARYHFRDMGEDEKEICKNNLMPLVDKIIKSTGKPALFANNQNWWLIAVTVVIREFLKSRNFKDNDDVEVVIDGRAEKVWGISDDDRYKPGYKLYHDTILKQIKNNVKAYVPKNVKFEIDFKSDTSNFYINLADIACGFVREDRKNIKQNIREVSCASFMDIGDPQQIADNNPTAALSIIFQEVFNNDLKNIYLVERLMKTFRKDKYDYVFIWDMFYDFLKSKIEERALTSSLVKIKKFVDIFLTEFKNASHNYLPTDKYIENLVLFVEYFSHCGEMELPFSRDVFLDYLKKTDENSETRILRKWEKMVSFTLHEAQIYFNAYNFTEINEHIYDIWDKHGKLIGNIPDIICDNNRKDEPTTALLGTLAQSYAYRGEYEDAIEYFNLSLEYSIKSTNRTYSYLFTIYHRNKDLEKARECFTGQTKVIPEKYYTNKEYNKFQLLSYFKLRALELYVKGNTELPHIELSELDNYNSEYPFPLVMKWAAISLYLENKEHNKAAIEKLFDDATTNLLREDNGFTINTLALPLIQCYALLNKQNIYHAKYYDLLRMLEARFEHFAEYVKSVPELKDINNSKDIMERALLLPFIYS